MAEPNYEKQIKIKVGSLKRLKKEYEAYEAEIQKQKGKIDTLKTNNADEYDIKKQIEVLEDSKQMLPNCKGRLQGAWDDLNNFITDYGDMEALKEHKPEAEDLLSSMKEYLEALNQTTS